MSQFHQPAPWNPTPQDRAIDAMQAIERLGRRIDWFLETGAHRIQGEQLTRAECDRGCAECFLRCASHVVGIKAWEQELVAVCGSSQIGKA